ncbi:MAG: aminopeptidase [Myxococcales bacterium]|nr:aminopeptidase [Myxococcales bacterium]
MKAYLVVALVTIAAPLASTGCWSGDYLAKQGVGQLKLLRARRRIDDVLRDPTVAADTKRRLALARDAREFGVRVLGLHGGDGFTRFVDSHGAPIAWNVTAARKDKLEAHLNYFPVVGAIPYLGFFDEADALREAARLRAQDLDVYVRGVAGYSTLGMTSDPIYSSMLDGPDARIVEVTLHEMLHATVYLAGHTEWNESLATVVGNEGAAQFFAARGDATSAVTLMEDARRRERDQGTFARFLEPVVRSLESLYAQAALSRAAKLEARERIFSTARAKFLTLFPPQPGKPVPIFAAAPLNNAVVLSYSVYHRTTPQHLELLRALGGDLRTFVGLCRHAVEDKPDPLAYLDYVRARTK